MCHGRLLQAKSRVRKKKMHNNINLDKNGGVKSEIEVYK